MPMVNLRILQELSLATVGQGGTAPQDYGKIASLHAGFNVGQIGKLMSIKRL
jgi:hypothetical protein